MEQKMVVLENWLKKLEDLGYAPAFYEEDGTVFEQVDCVIDGVSFAICTDDELDELWFTIIFEPERDIDEDEMAKIEGLDMGVFCDLLFADDGTVHFSVNAGFDCPLDFAEEIVASINNPDGAIQYLKSISYVW